MKKTNLNYLKEIIQINIFFIQDKKASVNYYITELLKLLSKNIQLLFLKNFLIQMKKN